VKLKQVAGRGKGPPGIEKTAELIEVTERVTTEINKSGWLELNASIIVNVIVLGMCTEFRRGSLLENFIWKKTGTLQTDNITTDFREMASEDGNEGLQRDQVRCRTFI